MGFLDLAKARYSVRKFSDKKIERDVMDKILEAGRLAPTACNNQPQKILVVQSEDALARLRKCTMSHFMCTAALIVCYDKNLSWKREYDGKDSGDIDAGIVTTQMMLEAAELGVGTTWVMHFIPEAVRAEFKLPDNYEATAILVMGYPAASAKPFPAHEISRDIGEMVAYNDF